VPCLLAVQVSRVLSAPEIALYSVGADRKVSHL